MLFSTYWKLLKKTEDEYLVKSSDKLTKRELMDMQNLISEMRKKGKNANAIIKYLQNHNSKLSERYKAERAFFTEVKRNDTKEVYLASEYLDIDEFRVLLSPNACEHCRKKTENGRKTFKSSEVKKGEGHVPPFHPNCYCVLIPK